MYQVQAWSALRQARGESRPLTGLRVGRNVVALGITSLLTDVSSEMVSTVLPIYLVLHLGLTPLQFGDVDGLYYGARLGLVSRSMPPATQTGFESGCSSHSAP
jgi:hypothetical protein